MAYSREERQKLTNANYRAGYTGITWASAEDRKEENQALQDAEFEDQEQRSALMMGLTD